MRNTVNKFLDWYIKYNDSYIYYGIHLISSLIFGVTLSIFHINIFEEPQETLLLLCFFNLLIGLLLIKYNFYLLHIIITIKEKINYNQK